MKATTILRLIVAAAASVLSIDAFIPNGSSLSWSFDRVAIIGGDGEVASKLSTSLQAKKDSDDDDLTLSDVRKARLAKESHNSKRFASGDELKSLREDLENLQHNLEWAKALKDEVRVESLQKAIINGQNRDPSFMYAKAIQMIAEARRMKEASQAEKDALIEKWTTVATAARELLPEFNLCGLWVGK
jgi:hypothetical protein